MPVIALFALAVPTVWGIGVAAGGQMEGAVFALQFLAGVCCLGIQFSINALSGIVYPTAARSMGSGMCLGVGRLGSIVGPIVGGALIARQLAIGSLYGWAALPFAVGFVVAVILARYYRKPGLA
jgi:AAHS family 4-hydroxybenzoate transporter-like MFS transporter